jgi:hypothetical protein
VARAGLTAKAIVLPRGYSVLGDHISVKTKGLRENWCMGHRFLITYNGIQ